MSLVVDARVKGVLKDIEGLTREYLEKQQAWEELYIQSIEKEQLTYLEKQQALEKHIMEKIENAKSTISGG